jgi:sulfhydrogenase subunit beta (sulfur reductase)
MADSNLPAGTRTVISKPQLQTLIDALASRGYKVIGPVVRDGAIVYDAVTSIGDLPAGWSDEQDAGRYRLRQRGDQALFGYAVGPHSWKRFLHPPIERLWQAHRNSGGFTIATITEDTPRYAFLGVRACELHAIAIQDRVFVGGPCRDIGYEKRRQDSFIIAVNCGEAGGTCFCVSMQTGPKADTGFDLALTELLDGDDHKFTGRGR